MITIVESENLSWLKKQADCSVSLIYIDPPFNTKKTQKRVRSVNLQANEYSYKDEYEDYVGFLRPRLYEALRILKANGSLFFHVDYREVHYCKVLLDEIFGRDSFMNEIIWAYDYGARSKRKWSVKHNNILWYAKSPDDYVFNFSSMDRMPYLAPGLISDKEKRDKGKTPTDVWWITIVPPGKKEATGYPTQKPIKLLDRIVKVHSNPGDLLLDFFAGSGSFGESAIKNNRNVILVDNNLQAIAVMRKRFYDVPNLQQVKC
jgi:site-specific DNA-methyltransferase (adenine-specific)